MMNIQPGEENTSLMLDGNALAGLFQDIFGVEMTVAPLECALCGRNGELGSLLAFTANPGYVLRCPGCGNILLRVAVTPTRVYLDARGAAFFSIPR